MIKTLNLRGPSIAITIGVLVYTLLLYTAEKVGVPRNYLVSLAGLFAAVFFAVAVMPGGTTQSDRFFHHSHGITVMGNALYMAGAMMMPFVLAQGFMLINMQAAAFPAIAAGIFVAMALSAVFVAPTFRRHAKPDLGSLTLQITKSGAAALTTAIAISLALFLLSASAISLAADALGWFMGMSARSATLLTMAMVVVAAILGGVVSVARLLVFGTLAFLIALNIPLFFMALEAGGIPIGQLTVGTLALQPLWDVEDQLVSLQLPLIRDIIAFDTDLMGTSGNLYMASGLLIAVGFAVFPPLLQSAASAFTAPGAGHAARRGLLIAGFALISLFAFAVYASYGFYTAFLGVTAREASLTLPALFSWGDREASLLQVCGQSVSSPQALLDACAQRGEQVLSTADLVINGSVSFFGATELAGLPLAHTAIITFTTAIVIIAIAAATILCASNGIASAILLRNPKATGGLHMFWSRLLCALFAAGAALVASQVGFDERNAFFFGTSLLAACAAPAWIALFHAPTRSAASVAFPVAFGLATTILFNVLTTVGIDLAPATGDEIAVSFLGLTDPLPGAMGGLYGFLVALMVLIITILLERFGGTFARETDTQPGEAAR